MNPHSNRLTITVDSASAIPFLIQRLEELRVPCHLVEMQVIGPVRVL
jgi:hypothetical protein